MLAGLNYILAMHAGFALCFIKRKSLEWPNCSLQQVAGDLLDILRHLILRCYLECDMLCLEEWSSEKFKKVSLKKDFELSFRERKGEGERETFT